MIHDSFNQEKKPLIVNMGCRLNSYESSIISSIIRSLDMIDDFAVINTCTVTNESERQCRQEIRKIKKQYPAKNLIVTGCASELHSEFFQKMPEVYFVIGNYLKIKKNAYNKIKDFHVNGGDKKELQKLLVAKDDFADDSYICGNKNEDIDDEQWPLIYDFNDKSRAFAAVHNGCNHYCSFCIIPFTRGRFTSVPVDTVIEQVRRFAQKYNEVVLTGVDITDYGNDDGKKREINLGQLCKKILSQTDIKRLRLSSVDVAEIDDDIIDLVANEKRFMPYFHISLQSGDNEILRKMRRRHKYETVIDFCQKVLQLRPEVAFGADIIAGFPGETKEQFYNSLLIVQNAPISYVHAFPYSKKEKTLAYSMNDDVTKDEKKRRVHLLIAEGRKNLNCLLNSMLLKPTQALVEKISDEIYLKSDNFAPMILTKSDNIIVKEGDIISVTPCEIVQDKLLCKIT
jgi:threonylcarbamoyladenosine tRNA methylthiotransferase MtaB